MDDLKPGAMVGPWRLERQLGRGGWGSVYLASRSDFDRKVALKVLTLTPEDDGEAIARFKREGLTALRVSHQGVPAVLDSGTTPEGVPWFAMEYLEGQTVAEFIARHRTVAPGVASALMLPVLAILDSAHAAGVVHRDLKPSNVMLVGGERREVKVLDFGLAKLLSQSLTRTGIPIGTPMYMAPEQARDGRSATASSDLYSAGAMLFELLTGEPPFEAANVMDLMAKVVMTPAPSLASRRTGLDPRLCELVDQLLAKSPRARPESAAVVRERLAEIAPPDVEALWALGPDPRGAWDEPTRQATHQKTTTAPESIDRRRLASVAGLVLAAIAATGLALALFAEEPGREKSSPASPVPESLLKAAPAVSEPNDSSPAWASGTLNQSLAALALAHLSQGNSLLARRLLARCVVDGGLCIEAAQLRPLLEAELEGRARLDEVEAALTENDAARADRAMPSAPPSGAYARYRVLKTRLATLNQHRDPNQPWSPGTRDPNVDAFATKARNSLAAGDLAAAVRDFETCDLPDRQACRGASEVRTVMDTERDNERLIADAERALAAGRRDLARGLLDEARATKCFVGALRRASEKLAQE